MLDNVDEYEAMHRVEKDLWWYRILHHQLHRMIKKNFGRKKSIKILDAGCGTGGFMKYLEHKGYHEIYGFDVSELAISFCNEKGIENIVQLDLIHFNKESFAYSFDAIISCDTFCYFDLSDQKKLLNNFYKSLNSNGIIMLNLPALNSFSGIHDLAVGIKHRFNLNDLKQMIDKEKYEILETRYWPFFLSPLIYASRKFQRTKIKKGSYVVKSDVKLPLFPINILFYLIAMIEQLLPFKYPFGSSLFIVLKKV